jgi:hypothetical protein
LVHKIRDAIDSCWARNKAFRVIGITGFLLVMAVPIFLLAIYARILLGVSFFILLIIVRLVFGYIAHKEGYVENFKKRSPKAYYYTRRAQYIMGGGLLTGFAILTTLRVICGPLPYPHSILLFLILAAIGGYVGNTIAQKRYHEVGTN